MFQMPSRSGTGVFQYRELSQQAGPPQTFPGNPSVNTSNLNNISNNPEPETLIIPNNPNVHNPNVMNQIPEPDALESTGQPDDEPTVPSTPVAEDPAITTPIPDETDDDLFTDTHDHDHWKIEGNILRRIHVTPRLKPFFPHDAWKCPVEANCLDPVRVTTGTYVSGGPLRREEPWTDNVMSHTPFPEPWTGQTQFLIRDTSRKIETSKLANDT